MFKNLKTSLLLVVAAACAACEPDIIQLPADGGEVPQVVKADADADSGSTDAGSTADVDAGSISGTDATVDSGSTDIDSGSAGTDAAAVEVSNPSGCKSDKDCDDKNFCTTDICDLVKGCVILANTSACNDGNACTTNDTCSGGNCAGNAVVCNDGNMCTDDYCDATTGKCVNVNNAVGCNDNNGCTKGDTCKGGACVGGLIVNCDDGNPNTTDSCNAATGNCVNTPNPSPQCPPSCDDNNPCTTDSCNAGSGTCVHANNTATCNDGNACTTGEACVNGACAGGNMVVCNDGNANTNDACDPVKGCVYTPVGQAPPSVCYGMAFTLPVDTTQCTGWPAGNTAPTVWTKLQANVIYKAPNGVCAVTCSGNVTPSACMGQWMNDGPAAWVTPGCWDLPGHPVSDPVPGCTWDSKCTPKP